MKTVIVFCLSIAAASAQNGAVVGAGYHAFAPVPVAPGQVVTVFVTGIGNVTQKYSAGSLPLPATLGGISATLNELGVITAAAPILAVFPFSACSNKVSSEPCGTITAVTLQIPFELQPNTGRSGPPFLAFLTISDQLGHAASMELNPVTDHIHVVDFFDTILGGDMSQPGSGGGVVTHADGSLVNFSKPAQPGEELVMYAVGLGATDPPVKTGAASPAPPVPTVQKFSLNFDYRQNALPAPLSASPFFRAPSPVFAGLTPGFAGLYQINFVVPAPADPVAPCTDSANNLTVTIAGVSFDGASICVGPVAQ
ncbi:MAG TPA: hypothetical protein VNH83_21440 [Bryobacteraceae bacterium]|nr:hypothetical protein [Bryobacteraceae bacterium]